jgi:phosphomannomutase
MEKLFKAYDIRGRYPSELNEQFAEKLGRAVAAYFSDAEAIIVGRDCRIGTDKLFEALCRGITAQGKDVLNIGICSTPMLYFATQDAPGVMITASHNPKEYNGFKVCAKGGLPMGSSNGLASIRQLIEVNAYEKVRRKGKVRRRDVLNKYVAHVRTFKGKLKNLKVVIDAGNGVQGQIMPKVFARLPVKIIPLAFACDGNFPDRDPNPIKQGVLASLCKAVKQNKANLGVAFDGDGDRVVFVDERGVVARPDHVLVLLAQYLLQEKPHSKVLYDLRSSRIVKEEVTQMGGVAIMTRVGHTYITHIMKEEDALIAGELSGHYYFRDNFYADNGDIPAMLMLSLLSAAKKPLSKLLAPLQKYANSGELNFTVADKERMLKHVEDEYLDKGKIFRIDGLTVEFPDWWFNLRPSNTEQVLRLNVEAKTQALLSRKLSELKRLLG